MSNYDNKMQNAFSDKQMKTTKTPGVTVIILDDEAKRGGDGDVQEYVRQGERKRAELIKIMRGER